MTVAVFVGSSVEPDVRAPVLPEVFMIVRPRRGWIQAAVIAAAVTGFATSAHAQLQSGPVDLQLFRPAMDSKGFITINSSGVLGQGDVSFGLVTSYARKPLVLNGPAVGGQPTQFNVNNLVSPSLQAAVGFTHLPHLGFGLGLAIIPSVILPTGDKKSFFGEGQTIFQPSVVLDTELGYLGRFRAAVNGGLRIRQHDAVFQDVAASFMNAGDPQASMIPTYMGTTSVTGAGISIGNE